MFGFSRLLLIFGLLFLVGCHSYGHALVHHEGSGSEVKIGHHAPAFSGLDTNGKNHSLADYRGKYVVLEWFNPKCPAVKPHYDNQSMQSLQRTYTQKGVVWLTIDSSSPGKEGFLTPAEGKMAIKERHAAPTALILDSDGKIGHAFGAKTTPHMFVIDPGGNLIYAGAIDDRKGKNYVQAALDEALAGKPVSIPATQSYGCSVKY
ncbi:MAG: thioredoxin family protein [Blastocatellia bacterium]|nr:thioredoxin family protein [Blastocatellia bacterium]